MADLITNSYVVLDLDEPDRTAATRRLAMTLAADGRVTDLDGFLADVRKREEQMATGLPGGIGIPQSDGTLGYSPNLRHGVTGKGLNDYDAIFRTLAGVGFSGWISVEDGVNGLDELRRSVAFLKRKREQYYG